MDTITIILLIMTVSTLNIVCFFVGAKVGQAVSRGETIQAPNLSPVKAYKTHRADKEADMEKNRLDIIVRNLDRYDGTANGQEDVPR